VLNQRTLKICLHWNIVYPYYHIRPLCVSTKIVFGMILCEYTYTYSYVPDIASVILYFASIQLAQILLGLYPHKKISETWMEETV
jgi:hypothetical protein